MTKLPLIPVEQYFSLKYGDIVLGRDGNKYVLTTAPTRKNEDDLWGTSAWGRSLDKPKFGSRPLYRHDVSCFAGATDGLPAEPAEIAFTDFADEEVPAPRVVTDEELNEPFVFPTFQEE